MFGILLICLIFHWAFSPFNLIKDRPLDGYYKKSDSMQFVWQDYFTRRYQDSTEKYINFQFGLFPGFTRIHHQLEYSLFDKINVHDVHKGENGYLMRYCEGCLSDNSFEPERLNNYLDKYERLKDSLTKAGKKIVWIIAPDKNIVFSEYLPYDLKHGVKVNGFYWDLKKALKQRQLDFIDFNEAAYRDRNRYPFAVINKGGVHWTQSYAARCFDSLCQFLSRKSNISIHNTFEDKQRKTAWQPDMDIEAAANLLAPLDKDNLFYTDMTSSSNAHLNKVLLIGDSFCHMWAWNRWLQKNFHPESEFWYYNRDLNTIEGTKIGEVRHVNSRKETEKFDTFIILFSAANVEHFDYGFVDDLYKP